MALETQIAELENTLGSADFYNQEASVIKQTNDKLSDNKQQLALLYERWEVLEAKKG